MITYAQCHTCTYICTHTHSLTHILSLSLSLTHTHTHTHTHIHPSSYPYWTKLAATSPMRPSLSRTLWPVQPFYLSRCLKTLSRESRSSLSFFVASTQRTSLLTLSISYCWESTLALGRQIIWSPSQSKYIMQVWYYYCTPRYYVIWNWQSLYLD